MKVVLPYVEVAPGVRDALKATGWTWNEVYVGDTDESYHVLIAQLWEKRRAFIVVEHDVIVREDTFDVLANCDNDWCAFPIPYLTGLYAGMACVKFSERMIKALPDALARAALRVIPDHPPRHWCVLDNGLRTILLEQGFSQCEHFPPLGHYRDYEERPQPSHGCCGTRVSSSA